MDTEKIAWCIRTRRQPISLTCSHPSLSSQSPLAAFAPRTCSVLDVLTPLPELSPVGARLPLHWGVGESLFSRFSIYDSPGPGLVLGCTI